MGHTNIRVQVSGCGQNQRGHPIIKFQLKPEFTDRLVTVSAIADTGAQTNLWNLDGFIKAGFDVKMLQKPSVKLSAANRQTIDVVGDFRADFIGYSPAGKKISWNSVVHVSGSVSGFFLSFDTLIKLMVVERNFPVVGNCPANSQDEESSKGVSKQDVELSVRALNFGCLEENDNGGCDCPQRSAVPRKPATLPFAPIPENIEKMKKWLMDRYASSTFNTCPHRPL